MSTIRWLKRLARESRIKEFESDKKDITKIGNSWIIQLGNYLETYTLINNKYR
jgi:hypothetical protein